MSRALSHVSSPISTPSCQCFRPRKSPAPVGPPPPVGLGACSTLRARGDWGGRVIAAAATVGWVYKSYIRFITGRCGPTLRGVLDMRVTVPPPPSTHCTPIQNVRQRHLPIMGGSVCLMYPPYSSFVCCCFDQTRSLPAQPTALNPARRMARATARSSALV